MTFYIDTRLKDSHAALGTSLQKCIAEHKDSWSELVFICIGTDRITGDSLGPYVGYCLSRCPLIHEKIYGTLDAPIHALNLQTSMEEITRQHPHGLYVAIDASLGTKKHLGFVTVSNGALHPGAGVQKDLPPVGHIAITGIVNASGWMEHLSLQTTRLSTVVEMADMISRGIFHALSLMGYTSMPEAALPDEKDRSSAASSGKGDTADRAAGGGRLPSHRARSIYPSGI